MKRTEYFLFAGFALVAMLFSNLNAMADDWDQKTVFTINQPVSVPGHVVFARWNVRDQTSERHDSCRPSVE